MLGSQNSRYSGLKGKEKEEETNQELNHLRATSKKSGTFRGALCSGQPPPSPPALTEFFPTLKHKKQ